MWPWHIQPGWCLQLHQMCARALSRGSHHHHHQCAYTLKVAACCEVPAKHANVSLYHPCQSAGQASCDACPAGSYNPNEASTSSGDCTLCDPGIKLTNTHCFDTTACTFALAQHKTHVCSRSLFAGDSSDVVAATSASVCSACGAGTVSASAPNPTCVATCTLLTQLCARGTPLGSFMGGLQAHTAQQIARHAQTAPWAASQLAASTHAPSASRAPLQPPGVWTHGVSTRRHAQLTCSVPANVPPPPTLLLRPAVRRAPLARSSRTMPKDLASPVPPVTTRTTKLQSVHPVTLAPIGNGACFCSQPRRTVA